VAAISELVGVVQRERLKARYIERLKCMSIVRREDKEYIIITVAVFNESFRLVAAVAVNNKKSLLPMGLDLSIPIKHIPKPRESKIVVCPATIGRAEVYRVLVCLDVTYPALLDRE
jgi:hypothetical protein